MKMRLDVSQKVLAILFGLSNQSAVSKIIMTVMVAFEKSLFVEKIVGFEHITRLELFEKHMKKFFTTILNIEEENLVLILDATYLYIQKPSPIPKKHLFDAQT